MARSRAVALVVCLVAAPGLVASAAPPADETQGEPDCHCEDAPTVEECVLARAIQLNGDGQDLFEAGDYDGAIAVLEEAIILLPESKRVRLAAPLANAHARAYGVDGDLGHLRAARELYTAHLESLDPSTQQKARGKTEDELAAIEAEFTRIETERDEKIRGEEAALREVAVAEVEHDSKRRIRRIHEAVGGSLLGLGGLSTIAMSVALWYGEDRDARGDQLALDANIAQSQYDTVLAQGTAANTAAWTTGVIGGALLVAGVTVTVIGELEYKPSAERDRAQARVRIRPRGLGFRF